MTGGSDKVRLEYDGPIAVITNDNPEKRNAFDDAMDRRLWEILGELRGRPDVRAVIWRGEGKAFSSGRDVAAIGGGEVEMTHHELMSQGHRGVQQIFDLDAPIVVAVQGWAIGASFQRALLCDIRIAAEDARFMLPEVTYGVIPDTGGVGRLFQMCGHGVASDMVLTGRPMDAAEAYAHGVVSRVVPNDDARRHRVGDRAQDRRGAGGHGEDGAPRDPAPRRAGDPFVDGRGAHRADVHQQVRRHGRAARGASRGARAPLHRELTHDDRLSRTSRAASPRGECAAGGHLRRHVRARHRWRHRSRQGDRERVRPPRREHRDREPQGGAPQRGEGGDRGARCTRGRHHRRHPRPGPDRGDVRRRRVGVPSSRRPHQQRGGELPGAVARTCHPTRGAASSTSR